MAFAEKCEELRAAKESRAKFESKSIEYVNTLKREIQQHKKEYE